MNKTLIIAEAGVNHNGSFDMAKQLVDIAAQSGADYIKFQIFKSESVICKTAEKAQYQKETTGQSESQLEMVKKLELSFEQHRQLKAYCSHKNIKYLCTPFDLESLAFLLELGLDTIKIPSGEITNYFLLDEIAKHEINVILSTGMSTLDEIKQAINLLNQHGRISNLTVLHCNTQYPTPFGDVNLAALSLLHEELLCDIGYSDHTAGTEVAVAAVALGAKIIEKHFTLSRLLPGPDHQASLEPEELSRMVKEIRHIELALGSKTKKVTQSEADNIDIARKFLVAARDIKAGTVFCIEDFVAKRTGVGGINPMHVFEVIGKVAKNSYLADQPISLREVD
ncbi:N-acetylneuraminate synthase [Pseudoalteromonas xiamenensis]|uniref:N-acetylneuraminate synthase n=1 Tax=Pseudoalteromonas xiamenensis TaxID=882626 RepID=UPI0027E43459|nr:N-acetylneuraminate synthase [Pseudoalteromonas xiamenensis]WMN59380.1 N-acetylneuraminate synthase [Pseudoalteromonas xiamenensis]